jgi:phosphoribosylformimino-5-aminoimidazole carboxamide ribonucleotide (ProFAR) isomerase
MSAAAQPEPAFHLLPAIDIEAGRLARTPASTTSLTPVWGNSPPCFASETGGELPHTGSEGSPNESAGERGGEQVLAYARLLRGQGARWLHGADLDAARGVGSNAPLLAAVVRECGVPVQWSGGVRSATQVEQALDAGAQRVNLAADTLADRQALHQILTVGGRQVSVALDVLHGQICPRGTNSGPIAELDEALTWLMDAGCAGVVVTDVRTDGALSGPNLPLLRHVCEVVAPAEMAVCASGGVATLDDLRQLRALAPAGLESVVLGSALLAGRFSLPQALAAVTAG